MFHGALTHFTYVSVRNKPPTSSSVPSTPSLISSLSPHRRTRSTRAAPDAAAAWPRNPDSGPQTSQSQCWTPIVMVARSANANAERQKHPTGGGASKRQRQNNHSSLKPGRGTAPDSDLDACACAARLPVVVQDVVPDHVAEDLDGGLSMIRCSLLYLNASFSQVLLCGINRSTLIYLSVIRDSLLIIGRQPNAVQPGPHVCSSRSPLCKPNKPFLVHLHHSGTCCIHFVVFLGLHKTRSHVKTAACVRRLLASRNV